MPQKLLAITNYPLIKGIIMVNLILAIALNLAEEYQWHSLKQLDIAKCLPIRGMPIASSISDLFWSAERR
jgi:hypothetical protein